MRAFMTRMIVCALILLAAGAGCQLAGSDSGLHISRMIPKPELDLFSEVPPQSEPELPATGPESSPITDEEP
jgi:hypothetical protein